VPIGQHEQQQTPFTFALSAGSVSPPAIMPILAMRSAGFHAAM